jgi:glycosyltransferase involved in cell wall biosynthesis
MRICLFTDSFLPYISGVSSAVINQANELATRGHEVSIFHPRAKKEDRNEGIPGLDSRVKTFGLPFSVPIPNIPKLRFSIPLFLFTHRRLKIASPDVIHVHTEFGCGIEGMFLGRWKKVPIVGTFHTFFAEPEYLKQFHLPNFSFTRKAMWKYSVTFYNYCSYVVSPSKSVRDNLVQRGLKTKVTLLSNGIDPIQFRPKEEIEAFRQSLGIDDFAFIYVGRISPEKSLGVLLGAFYRVTRVNPDVKLVIVGAGPSDSEIDEKVAEFGIEKEVVRTGRIERDILMKENYLLLGDVFVTASKTENQPVSLLEAMAFGLPMIGPRAKGIPELVEDGNDGLIFEPDDEQDMADSMIKLMKDKRLRSEMSQAATDNASDHSMEKTGSKLEQLYRDAIG